MGHTQCACTSAHRLDLPVLRYGLTLLFCLILMSLRYVAQAPPRAAVVVSVCSTSSALTPRDADEEGGE